jgi:hypothetical protein
MSYRPSPRVEISPTRSVEHCSLRAILTLGLTLPLWLDLTLPLSLELGSPITGLPSRSALVAPPLRLAALWWLGEFAILG